ncbi:MAG: glutamine synthetase beta-grasp domain-containing protein, partial [Proteobacteria bacterium]|nr:glutamine synthetase beta-grasp domain-containing protein [Pseudomonadota bacterium]
MYPADVLALAKEKQVRVVDLRFLDLLGTWQHFSVPATVLSEEMFEDGVGFDGSSIRGWRTIDQSDMLVIPDPATAWIDPFLAQPTLVLSCNVVDTITREEYGRDPRNVARRAENYLCASGVGDRVFFGPEAEFFIFDDVRFGTGLTSGVYQI